MTGSARSGWYHRMSGTVAILVATATLALVPHGARAACAGDCNSSGAVTVDDLLAMVSIALGNADVSTCTAGDTDMSKNITIDEILAAVNNALTGCPTGTPCGNGAVDSGEDCDTGGTCIGGTNAGTACTAENQCTGDGVCLDGLKTEWVCSNDGECPGSKCIHCKTFGGSVITGDSTHTCAANCTFETVVDVPLVPGDQPDLNSLTEGTSGLLVHSPTLDVGIPLPSNLTRHLAIGKKTDGKIPVTLKAAMNQTPGVKVFENPSSHIELACICLRPVVLKTCGGTLWEKNGTPSTDCTPNYTAGDSLCPATKPCTLVYGADNDGLGEVGCDSLNGFNVETTRDSLGESGIPGPVLTTLTDTGGAGGPGSSVVFLTTELGFVIATCTGTDESMYGKDHHFCTDDDPQSARGTVLPQVLTTGTATSAVFNADATAPSCSVTSETLCHVDSECPPGETCLPLTIGPFSFQGQPFSCSALTSNPPGASGAALAGAFPSLNAPTIGDIVVTNIQVTQ